MTSNKFVWPRRACALRAGVTCSAVLVSAVFAPVAMASDAAPAAHAASAAHGSHDYGAPAPAAASQKPLDPFPLTMSAFFFTRFELRDGYDRLGVSQGRFLEGDTSVYRARVGLRTAPIDIGAGQRVQLQFTPQAAGFVGNTPSPGEASALAMFEGYIHLANDAFTLDVGRFSMNYGDAYVIGDPDWNQGGRSFDGARTRIAPKGSDYFVDVFATQVDERGLSPFPGSGAKAAGPDTAPGAGDVYFTGVYADVGGLLTEGLTLEPYALAKIWPATQGLPVSDDPTKPGTADTKSAALLTLGARVKYHTGPVDYRVEGGVQGGSRIKGAGTQHTLAGTLQHKQAYSAVGEVGLSLLDQHLRLALEGNYASGDDSSTATDDEGWDELFPTAHRALGLMDVMVGTDLQKRRNIYSGAAKVEAKTTRSTVLRLDAHLFGRPRAPTGRSAYSGAELDAQAIWSVGRAVKLRGLYGAFFPGSNAFPAANATIPANDQVAHYFEAELRCDF